MLPMSVEDVNSLPALGNAGTMLAFPLAALVIDQGQLCAVFGIGVTLTAAGCALRLLGLGACLAATWSFILGQLLANVGSGFLNLLPAPLAVRRFPSRNRGFATGLGELGVLGGGYGGPLLGRVFRHSPSKLLWCQFAGSFLLFPSFLLTREAGARAPGDHGRRQVRQTGFFASSAALYSTRGMAALVAGYTAANTVFGTFAGVLEQLSEAFQDTAWTNSMLSGGLVVGTLVGVAVSGPAADALGFRRALLWAAWIAAIGWATLLAGFSLEAPSLAAAGWALVAFMHGGALPTLAFVTACECSQGREGTACAHLNFFPSASSTLIQVLVARCLTARHSPISTQRQHRLVLFLTAAAWGSTLLVTRAVAMFSSRPHDHVPNSAGCAMLGSAAPPSASDVQEPT